MIATTDTEVIVIGAGYEGLAAREGPVERWLRSRRSAWSRIATQPTGSHR